MKIKVRAEDFVVREVVSLDIHNGSRQDARAVAGPAPRMAFAATDGLEAAQPDRLTGSPNPHTYRIYLLHKRGWNTIDALKAAARESGIPFDQIGYAGLKDRYASTSQYVSVPAHLALVSSVPGVPADDLRVEQVGFADDFVSTRVLIGNRFAVTLRDLSDAEARALAARVEEVRNTGLPNYFDDQRFGSVPPAWIFGNGADHGTTLVGVSGEVVSHSPSIGTAEVNEFGKGSVLPPSESFARCQFLAERVLKGHLKGAIRLYMTAEYPSMSFEEKTRKRAISDAWGDWAAVLSHCESETEKRIVMILQGGGNKKNLLAALNAVPHDEMGLHFAAYQSAVWNEVLRRLIVGTGVPLSAVEGRVGQYLFPTAPSPVIPADNGRVKRSAEGRVASDEVDLNRNLETLRGDGGRNEAAYRLARLRGLEIPTIARKMLPSEPDVEQAIWDVLAARGIGKPDMNLRGFHSAYFKSFYRKAFMGVKELWVGETAPDDEYRGKRAVTLSFELPRGSYATMLLKALSAGAWHPAFVPAIYEFNRDMV